MSLQARMSQDDPRLYNPNRDVAHNFDQVIMEVAKRCESGTWDALTALAKEKGLSDEDLGKACQALCRFAAKEPEKGKSMPQCLAECGFLELPATARIIVAAYMGTVFPGIREATIQGQGPAQTYKKLRWHGMMCAKLMTMPAWKRKLYVLWGRIKRAWRVLRQTDIYGE